MALELRQHLKLTQQLILTPQLQQAIKLLQLNRVELTQFIRQEMEINPLLEEDEKFGNSKTLSLEDILSPNPQEAGLDLASESPLGPEALREFDWKSYFEDAGSQYPTFAFEEKESLDFERRLSRPENLTSYLLWQLYLSDLDKEEREIGEYIIGNLTPGGYLCLSVDEIAKDLNKPQEKVEFVIQKIQSFDPVGVASRNLKECLLIQIKYLNLSGTLVEKIVLYHLHDLEFGHYENIARAYDVSLEDVEDAIEIIKRLEPWPARNFSDELPQYIEPDVYVIKDGNEWVVRLNEEGLPRLKISPYYRELLKDPNLPLKTKQFIQKKLRSALWLIKSIEQRQRTLLRVTESIMRFQREFLENGIMGLKPLVLRDVATDLELHESTVSRVTTGKYIDTPHGIFELKFFFSRGYASEDGEKVSTEIVKEYIKEIIGNENPQKPYSDKKIADILKEKYNVRVARRTIAKYRDQLGILPANRRRRTGGKERRNLCKSI